jgi:hypothetical protein
MSSLAELQSLMTAAIFKGHAAEIEDELVAGHADPARRFGIYRNNTFLSLTAHLKAVFPATARLGDERFFAYAANEYIRRAPPREPRLAVYGADFPRFLARFPASRGTPILAEMAALEWAVQEALIAREGAPLDSSALAEFGPGAAGARLAMQPGLRFVLSRWPLLGLWSRSGGASAPLPRKTTRLAVRRRGDAVRIIELSPARFAFWRALEKGSPLERAAASAYAREASFDLVRELGGLFGAGLVIGILPERNLH